MPIIVQCPACEKKMKIKEPTPGKKIRCPGCQEPFVPKSTGGGGGRKPAKKKRPAPADDYDDFGDDDYGDDYEEKPRRKPAAAAATGGKRRRSSARRKPPAGAGKSRAPLIIGISVLAIAAIGGAVWAFMGDDDSGGDAIADTDPGGGDSGAGDNGEGGNAGANSGGGEHSGGSEHGGGGEHAGGGRTPNALAANTGGGGSGQATPYTQTGPVDLSYIPASAEAVVKIDIARLAEGPLGQLLEMEQVSGQLQMAQQLLGITVKDIDSVTVGVGGISDAISSGRPPEPENFPATVIIRTSAPLDQSKLTGMIPGGQPVSEGGASYTRVPSPDGRGPAAAVWFVDSNTIVAGMEPVIKTVAPIPPQPSLIDTEMFDGTSPIQVVFSPKTPDGVFRHPNVAIPPQAQGQVPPAAMKMITTLLANADGAGIGFDLTNDIGFSMSVRCKDSAGATQLQQDMQAANDESKAQAANGPQNPMMMPFMGIQKAMEESQKLEVNGTMVRMSSSAPGGGQQVAALMPMVVGMLQLQMQQGMAGGPGGMSPGMMGPGMGGPAERAAPSTQDKMKNIALGIHNFHDVYRRMPNSVPQGINHDGLSWRVHLLPFLGHEELYEQFDVEQPWDSPKNMALLDEMPEIYSSDVTTESGQTVFQVPSSPGTLFEAGRGRSMSDVIDGTSMTVLLVASDAESAVPWTKPTDFQVNMASPSDGLGLLDGGFLITLLDGSTIVLDPSADAIKMRGLFTYRGGERVNPAEMRAGSGGGF